MFASQQVIYLLHIFCPIRHIELSLRQVGLIRQGRGF
jgi:hypothetical protein